MTTSYVFSSSNQIQKTTTVKTAVVRDSIPSDFYHTKYLTTRSGPDDSGGKVYSQKSRTLNSSANWARIVEKNLPKPFNDADMAFLQWQGWYGFQKVTTVGNEGKEGWYTAMTSGSFGLGHVLAAEGSGLLSSADKAACTRIAINKLLNAVKDVKVDAGTAAAEAAKTGRMIIDAASKIASAIHHLRRGNFAGAAANFGGGSPKRARNRFERGFAHGSENAVATAWLELQYGWKPLLSDIYGACEHLAKGSQGSFRQVSAKHIIRKPIKISTYVPPLTRLDEVGVHIYTQKYTARFTVGNTNVQDLKSLGITNPLNVAWELVPFSFVVDWFLPVGNWISTFDATLGITFAGGCVTGFSRVESVHTVTYSGKANDKLFDARMTKQYKKINFARGTLTAFPSPQLPVFKSPVSGLHIMNSLALLSSIFRK